MSYEFQRAKDSLSTIGVVKQDVFENSYKVFEQLKTISQEAALLLESEMAKIDTRIRVEYRDINIQEFWLQFGGDILIFSLHTNVFSFDKTNSLFNTRYITENPLRAYFSMIEVFNFLNDSVRFNRSRDIGEMVGRIFINSENHFFVEGIGAVGSLYSDLSTQVFEPNIMNQILESLITASINYDLWAPPFNETRFIPLQAILDKNGNSPRTTSKRLGFSVS